MNTTTKHATPIASSADRESWLEARRQGVTATEASKLAIGSSTVKREIMIEKVTGTSVDLSGNRYVERGNQREPIIAEWMSERFDIDGNQMLFSAAENVRHLATPDGVSVLWPHDKTTAEIKTSKHDLREGASFTVSGRELDIEASSLKMSRLWLSGYYSQVQWQMRVMGGDRVLFIGEQHDDHWPNPKPVSDEPDWFWIPRDQSHIDELVELAEAFIVQLDASRTSGIAPTGDMPSEIAQLTHELLAARDAEAVAKSRKDIAWKRLQELLLEGDDVKLENIEATVTVSTTTSSKRVVDIDSAKAKAPALVAKYEALIERFTKIEPVSSKRLTVTAKKGNS